MTERTLQRGMLLLIIVALFFPLALRAAEGDIVTDTEEACPIQGQVPITPDLRDEARAAGIKDDVPCWNPNDKNTGAAVGAAKEYLHSILCANVRDNYGGAGPDATITNLNGGFAVCAARFLKAANAQINGAIALRSGGTAPVCINEGYRTQEKQMEYWIRYQDPRKACDPTNRVCEHTTGLAIDVNTSPNSNYPAVWNIGNQYGVTFYLGWDDPYHFRAATTDCRSTGTQFNINAPTGGSTPTGSSLISPSTFDFPVGLAGLNAFQSPQTSLLQQLGSLVAPLTQSLAGQSGTGTSIPLATPITPTISSVSNPLTTGATGNSTNGGTNTVTNPLSTSGSSNPVNISSSANLADLASSTVQSVQNPLTVQTTGAKALSPSMLIDILAGISPGGSTDTGVSATILQVNGDVSDAGTVSAAEPSTTAPLAGTQVSQTFISSDLRNSPVSSQSFSTVTAQPLNLAGFSSLLDRLKVGLLSLFTTPAIARPVSESAVWSPLPQYLH